MPEIKLIDDVRNRLNRGRKPDRQFPAKKALHFRDLEHDVRKYYAARIAQASLTTAVVLIKKRDLLSGSESDAEEKQLRSVLYHVATLALTEAISYHCTEERTIGDVGDGSVDLVFSSRSSLDYSQLRSTIEMVLADPTGFNYQDAANAGIIRSSQVQAIMHSKSMGLQIADAVTSSYYYAVESSADGLTEDGYVRLLLPCACRHSGKLFEDGIKVYNPSQETWEEMQIRFKQWER